MSTSPLHVHVKDNTPLHVHVKKPKKNLLKDREGRASVPHKFFVRSNSRAKSKSRASPWIPAPGRTSTRDKVEKSYVWDSMRTQLEIHPPDKDGVDMNVYGSDGELLLRASDLEEENKLKSHIGDYEQKIEQLMAEVGNLKSEGNHLNQKIENHNYHKKSKMLERTVSLDSILSDNNLFIQPHPNYHAGCFTEVESDHPNEKRVEETLCKLAKAAAVNKIKKKSKGHVRIEPTKNLKCRLLKGCGSAILFSDSSYLQGYDSQRSKASVKSKNTPKTKAKSSISMPSTCQYKQKVTRKEQTCPGVNCLKLGPEPHHMSPGEWEGYDSCNRYHEQMKLRQAEEELGNREEQLKASRTNLQCKRQEAHQISNDCKEILKENSRLRQSMDRHRIHTSTCIPDDFCRVDSNRFGVDDDRFKIDATLLNEADKMAASENDLLHQLVDVEVSGAEAGKQVASLREVIKRINYEKGLSPTDVEMLSRQKELLLKKLDDFEALNRAVRRLLKTEQKTTADTKKLEEQRDILVRKMAESDSDNLKLRSQLIQATNAIDHLSMQIDEEKKNTRNLNEITKAVESTRAHLQRELRSRDMENSRLHIQLKKMQGDAKSIQREAEEIMHSASTTRDTLAREKDGLKRATICQRNRADQAEARVKDLEYRLDERALKMQEAHSQTNLWRERYQRVSDDKLRMDDHLQSLAGKVAEHDTMARTNGHVWSKKEDEMQKEIEKLLSDNATSRSDAERYKSDAVEAKAEAEKAKKEAAALRTDLKQYESTTASLRTQLREAKSNVEEAMTTAERIERGAQRLQEDGSNEMDRVREQMLERMKDLQPLPGLLKESETKLQDAQDKIHAYEQKTTEQARVIAELSNKDDNRGGEVQSLRREISELTDENRSLEARIQLLHVKLDERDIKVKEGVIDTVSRDDRIQQLQLKLEEMQHERDSLKRKLGSAANGSRKVAEAEKDKAAARERMAEGKIVELETKNTRLKTDAVAAKREKEDIEKRLNSKLQDARDRLEQAEAMNKSMRNYVNFLKTSYNNVFGGEASLTSTPIRSCVCDSP